MMLTPKIYLTDLQYRKVTKCSACGRTHWIMFRRMPHPVQIGKREYEFVGLCPRKVTEVYMQEEVELAAED
jgi:hypothetical protein